MLITYFVAVLIPALVISGIFLYFYSEETVLRISKNSNQDMHRIADRIGSMVDQMSDVAVRLSLTPGLNKAMSDPQNTSMYQYEQFVDILGQQRATNQLFDSMALFFRIDNRFLSTEVGFQSQEEYYDQGILALMEQNKDKSFWFANREMTAPGGERVDTITFAQKLPVLYQLQMGELIINVGKRAFANVIIPSDMQGDFLVLDNNNQIVVGNLTASSEKIGELIPNLGNPAVAKTVLIDGKKQFATQYQTEYNGWTIFEFTPYSVYSNQMHKEISKVLYICFMFIMIGAAVAGWFAFRMYRPWKRITNRLSENTAGDAIETSVVDEVIYVEKALSLIEDNIKRHEPILRDRLVFDILHNYIVDDEQLRVQLSNLEMIFPHQHFLVIVVQSSEELGEAAHSESYNRLFVFNLVLDSFKSLGAVYGTMMDAERFGFLLNLEEYGLNDTFRDRVRELCAELNRLAGTHLNISLQVSLGTFCSSLEDVYKSYFAAKRELLYRSVIGDNDVIFPSNTDSEKVSYPSHLQKKFIHASMNADEERALAAVRELFDHYVYSETLSRQKTQQIIIIFLSSTLYELMEEGFDLEEISEESILEIANAPNHKELKTRFFGFVNKIQSGIRRIKDKEENIYIKRAMQYMKEHYDQELTVTMIAEESGVSSGHLGRLFREEVGKSVLNVLTEIRMEASKPLLLADHMPLEQISRQIGYNDVHSFIRFFKKAEGVTPGEYRKIRMEAQQFEESTTDEKP
ncbi:helix-turn-helix domain-containing protein [Paenibacillus sp. HB172176]|uniref:helix-turn-helix transcriptional regulator n=1 Tax=Paenibacillus sp. HB172176 TaxID=2493690 RepID=UPI00143C058B|nr:helix-turn-helix domain-containing protein [Paenibacillus sp. HB172176]